MQHVFAILPNRASNRSFERYFRFVHQAQLHTYQTPLPPPSDESSGNDKWAAEALAGDESSVSCGWVTETFASIAEWLNSKIRENELSSGIGIIELYDERLTDLSHLNPIHTRQTWAAAAAMLILAFPEIYWIFITPHPFDAAENSSRNEHFDKFYRLRFLSEKTRLNFDKSLKIGAENFSPLFDPSGFRSLIRENICRTDSRDAVDYIPRRRRIVVTIDEEEDYVSFASYIAYRFGYLATQVNSFSALENLREFSPEKFHIAFEDMFLNFPDRPLSFSLSDLAERHNTFLKPEKIDKLVLVTSGHDKSLDKETLKKNTAFINGFDESGKFSKINKPFSGIFKFWHEAKECDEISKEPFFEVGYKTTLEKMRPVKSRENSPDSVEQIGGEQTRVAVSATEQGTPVEKKDEIKTEVEETDRAAVGKTNKTEAEKTNEPAGKSTLVGHSAHGRLLLIANCLIKRARRLSENANTAKDATCGATLAIEAIEYLGYRTPTISLQALSLKNKMEVMAEAMFYGVHYGIGQQERFKEIETEIDAIGEWYKKDGSAELNAEIKIINDMALVFQQQGLFDEENECLERNRSLYQQLSQRRKPGSRSNWRLIKWANGSLNFAEQTAVRYANFLLKSIWNFLLAVLGCVWFFTFFFAFVFWYSSNAPTDAKLIIDSFGHGLYDSCIAFFSMQPAHDMSGAENEKIILIASIFCIIISYFHLGIFISYVYTLITRKQ